MSHRYSISSFLLLVGIFSVVRAQSPLTWNGISAGVNYASAVKPTGHDVFIGFSGWTIQQEWANTWVSSLYFAKLRGMGVGHLYSVMGPKQDDYAGRELGTRSLARSLIALMRADTACKHVIVAAHSSGSFVAHALFQDLFGTTGIDSGGVTIEKITYFNLDGGIGNGGTAVPITQEIADRLEHVYAVYAFEPELKLYSPNKAAMVELGSMFGSKSSALEIDVTGCGCSGAWCVHQTLIVQKPHNPKTFDLELDYHGFNAEHPVTTSYLEVLTSAAR